MSVPYRRLDSSRREIRLLEIQAARNINDPIEARLVHVRLTEDLEFIALSSLYGDSTETDKIFVGGQPVTLTSHLTQALKHVRAVFYPTVSQRFQRTPARRPPGAPRWLRQLLGLSSSSSRGGDSAGWALRVWCDFLCVNPRDEYERSKQHTDMRTVYKAAALVVGWVGSKTEHTDIGMAMIAEIDDAMPPTWGDPGDAEKNPQDYSPTHEWTKKIAWIWGPGPDGTLPDDSPHWIGATDFIMRQYFQRRWILEEISMARFPTFLIGDIIVPWKQILRLNRLIDEFRYKPSDVFPSELSSKMAELPLETAYKLLDEYAKREALEESKILRDHAESSRTTSSSRSTDNNHTNN
ncbi:heterokaryon incompatibility protein [Colletotrichum sojae]|uniref:Heterokaryon incompatibility protein n=1 Tax=Colletotrichum sojae TaxID=2175907 RepID=A0A8H6N2R2_9PEZI|nr:heterokaryon incompatibility protein [Colletotrichum sojae]